MNRVTALGLWTTKLVCEHADLFSGRVLDIGCGSKPYKRLFCAPNGDYREGITEWLGYDSRPVGEVQGDAQSLPFKEAEFDTILCTDVLQYVPEPQLAVDEMARVLKASGLLILTCPNCGADDDVAFWGFKSKGLGLLAEQAGLKVTALGRGGEQFTSELDGFRSRDKYGVQLPAELNGWAAYLDDAFPLVNLLIATKE